MDINDLIKQVKSSRYPASAAEVAAHNLCNPHAPKVQRYYNEEYFIDDAKLQPKLVWSVNNSSDSTYGKCEITDPDLLRELALVVGKQAALHAAHRDKLQLKLAAVNELLSGE